MISFEPSLVTDAMKAGFLLSIVLSFPLCVMPCRTSLNSLLFGRVYICQQHFVYVFILFHLSNNRIFQNVNQLDGVALHPSGIPDWRFRLLTLAIVGVTLVIGICIPNVEFVLGLVGSTLGTLVCSIGPAWIYLQVAPPSSGERWIAKVLVMCGVAIFILGTAANIYAEEEYSEGIEQREQHLVPLAADRFLEAVADEDSDRVALLKEVTQHLRSSRSEY